jgi:hypothetical protein
MIAATSVKALEAGYGKRCVTDSSLKRSAMPQCYDTAWPGQDERMEGLPFVMIFVFTVTCLRFVQAIKRSVPVRVVRIAGR